MDKIGQTMIVQAIVFFAIWVISWLIWSKWLDGIYAALAGCVTALAAMGVLNIVIHVRR